MANLAAITSAIVAGKKDAAGLVTQALKEDTPAEKIVSEAIEAGLDELERKHQRNELYMPDVLVAKRAIEGCMVALAGKVTVESEEKVRSHLDRLQSFLRNACSCGTHKRG